MLFNSYTFILIFLPLSLLIYHGFRRAGCKRASILTLTLLSLFFYGWWNPIYLLLLVPLVLMNFVIATRIIPLHGHPPHGARVLVTFGIAANIGVLMYFKYANFFVDNLNMLLGLDLFLATIVLPLGISFFTFQKIAFLVDAYQGKVQRLDLLDFSLFVTFFPQLIAGPIVHHAEMLPQFRRKYLHAEDITLGITFFAVGLLKKVLLADTAGSFATPVFNAVANGTRLDLLAAWSGALAYTAQLYFDFSGYSDMAIGAAMLFGIRLPLNFASPYKATSIIDFWHRWHMTLSRFLRDYVYIPLGGNRCSPVRRYVNVFVTMIIGGFWHGAAWTFVIWGGLHALYLGVNHAWRSLRPSLLHAPAGCVEVRVGQILTFIGVVVGWVVFRADDISSAMKLLAAMAGRNGIAVQNTDSVAGLILCTLMLMIAWLAPNIAELTNYRGPLDIPNAGTTRRRTPWLVWRPTPAWAVITGCLLAVAIMSLSRVSEFLYFQF